MPDSPMSGAEHHTWVERRLTPAERAAELSRTEREAERDRLLDLLRSSLECFFWSAVGLVMIGWAFHTTDPGWGQIAFYGGLVVGNGGILYSLLAARGRAIDRGDDV